MNQCIYYKYGTENLEFSNQEHIIPAGLGGITKLPRGYVSNEANNFFSSFELRALRNSMLSINRNNHGPGRRGSLNVQNVRNPVIHIFNAVTPEKELDTTLVPLRLGFLFAGVVQILPQVYIRFDELWNMRRPLYVADNFSNNPEETMSKFLTSLVPFLKNKQCKFIFVEPPTSTSIKFVSIGYYEKKYYVCSSIKPFRINNFCNLLLLRPLPELNPFLLSSATEYHYSYDIGDLKDVSFPLVYIKTAFNALTLFMGHSFVLESIFDPLRNNICNTENLDSYWIRSTMPSWLVNWVKSAVPTKAHFVVIHGQFTIIDAYVSFYREPLNSIIRLTSEYTGETFKMGLICDWKTRKEQKFYMID